MPCHHDGGASERAVGGQLRRRPASRGASAAGLAVEKASAAEPGAGE